MASSACTNLAYKFYNGGWSAWRSNLFGGYAGSSKYVAVLSFKTPDISGLFTSTSFSITIPYVRQTNSTTGTLYIKLYTSDPTGTTGTTGICAIPTANTCDASCAWNTNDQQVHKANFTITKSLAKNTTYYLVVGASGNYMEIGYNSSYNSWFSINLNYTAYTNATASKPTITDTKKSTFTITAQAGSAGTNNAVKSTTLYYRIGDSGDYTKTSSLNIVNQALTCDRTSKSQNVYAYSVVDGTHNDATSDTAKSTIINYAYPNEPGNPYLTDASYRNGRLTLKQNWTFKWTAATKANDNSPILGYRLRMYKNDEIVRLKNSSTGGWLGSIIKPDSLQRNDSCYDTDSTSTEFIVNPSMYDFKPGDKIKFGVYAYTKNGAGTQLFSNNGKGHKVSNEYTIQNAGVVQVKVNNTWKEGQVYVKVNGTWREAETVSTKVNGSWKESQ